MTEPTARHTPPSFGSSVENQGLVDTSILIDWDDPEVVAALPDQVATSAITLAELAAGPHLAKDIQERASRQARLQQVESLFDALDFDAAAARSYGQVVAAVIGAGGSHRSRVAALLIAAIAHSNQMPLYTRNPQDFMGLDELITVIAV